MWQSENWLKNIPTLFHTFTDKQDFTIPSREQEWDLFKTWLKQQISFKRLQVADKIFHVKQIHGAGVLSATIATQQELLGQADGLWTNQKAQYLVVKTADCVPVLLCDPQTKLIAAVHSGWRGAAQNILGRALTIMQEQGTQLSDIQILSGPCISADAYEIKEDVAHVFKNYQGAVLSSGNRLTLDLRTVLREQALQAGLKQAQIEQSALCTYTETDRCYSFRRDGTVLGHHFAVIGWY